MDEIGEDELMWMQINDEILHNECGAIENENSNNNMGANGSACVDDQFVADREEVPNWVNYKDMHETEDCVDLDDHGAIEVGEENQVSLYEEQDLNEEQHTNPDKDVRGWDDWTRPIIDSDDESENELSRYHKRVRNMKVWDDFTDLRKVELGVYSRFKNAHVFRGVMKHYAADKGFDFLYTRNEPKAIGVICKETDCPFYIWCTTVQGSTDMEIKTCYPDHTCERAVNNEQLTSDFLAKRYSTYIGDNPNINIKSFQKYVHKDLEANVSEYRLYRAIRRARTDMAVDTSVQYAKLYEYLEMVKKTNSDCYWRVEVEHHAVIEEEKRISRFLRMYLRFGPEKKGFIDGCRPFIGIDGCHLKGYYGGQLLSAVAWDANDGMFPLAFAIVEAENKQSWKWFLETLFDDFDNNDQGSWVFISDKQKGLVELFKDWLPNVEHRYCMRHIYEMTCSKCNKKGHNKRSCSTKDYGETTLERKQRKKMSSNNDATTNKSRLAEGSNMNHESTKRTRDSQSNTNKVNVQLKREATLKKMEKRRKKMPQQQPNQCNTATECTPQQIEAKRQAALQKMASKGQECSTQQTGGEEWMTGIYRTKRKKLQTIRKSLSTQGCNFGSNLPNPPIPACGLAQNELNQCRNAQKSFTMLSGNSSTTTNNEKGNGASKTSRFAVEVLFSRSAKNQAEKGANIASTQPPKRTHASSTICPDPPHCSQL